MKNEDIFSTHNYRLNKIYMHQLGVWPEQSLSKRIFLPFINIVTVATIIVPQVVRMYDFWGQFDYVIEGLPSLLVVFISWIKLINSVIKRPALFQLANRIRDDWESLSESSSEIKIFTKYAQNGRTQTIIYSVFVYGATIMFSVLPTIPAVLDIVAPLNETREKKFIFPVEYRVDMDKYYLYITMHGYFTAFMCIMIYVTIDTMFTVWVQHCCALFAIVGHNLRHAIDKHDANTSEVNSSDELAYRNLCSCIRQHDDAMIFAHVIESTYSMSLGLITALNMVIMSITGVLLVIKLGDRDEALRFVALCIGQVYHLYYNSVSGQTLIDHSNAISYDVYNADWYEFSPRTQKLLILIIERGQKPCLLTAGKIYVINMENFSMVVNTSVSYFTVLSSFR